MEPIKTRVLQFALASGRPPSLFSQSVFATNNFFTVDKKINAQQIAALAEFYPDLNINWILTGCGHMIQSADEVLSGPLEEELPIM